jgi:hypothetical protein
MVKRSTIPAHHQRQGRRGYTGSGLSVPPNTICGVVIHDMEAPERLDTAEAVARYFARPDIRPSSAHKNFDADSIVISVADGNEAFHAPPASRWTLGYEQAGYARQSAAEWNDPYSRAMIQIVAAELAADAQKHGFPLVERSIDDLRAGRIDGVYTHNSVSKAFGQSDHWDPGPNYPMGDLIKMAAQGVHTVQPPKPGHVLRLGGPVKGEPVAFFGDMANIMAAAGFALNKANKPSYVQIPIPKSPQSRKLCTFNGALHARAEEIQRFATVMWLLGGRKGRQPVINGIVDEATTGYIAYWVPIAVKKLTAKK